MRMVSLTGMYGWSPSHSTCTTLWVVMSAHNVYLVNADRLADGAEESCALRCISDQSATSAPACSCSLRPSPRTEGPPACCAPCRRVMPMPLKRRRCRATTTSTRQLGRIEIESSSASLVVHSKSAFKERCSLIEASGCSVTCGL
jgi:hypothetical protein